MREDTKDLARSMNLVYNSIIFSCQKRCITTFTKAHPDQPATLAPEESACLVKCANENMFLDNFLYEIDSAQQLASTQGKPKKGTFYIGRRIEDLTSPTL